MKSLWSFFPHKSVPSPSPIEWSGLWEMQNPESLVETQWMKVSRWDPGVCNKLSSYSLHYLKLDLEHYWYFCLGSWLIREQVWAEDWGQGAEWVREGTERQGTGAGECLRCGSGRSLGIVGWDMPVMTVGSESNAEVKVASKSQGVAWREA